MDMAAGECTRTLSVRRPVLQHLDWICSFALEGLLGWEEADEIQVLPSRPANWQSEGAAPGTEYHT